MMSKHNRERRKEKPVELSARKKFQYALLAAEIESRQETGGRCQRCQKFTRDVATWQMSHEVGEYFGAELGKTRFYIYSLCLACGKACQQETNENNKLETSILRDEQVRRAVRDIGLEIVEQDGQQIAVFTCEPGERERLEEALARHAPPTLR